MRFSRMGAIASAVVLTAALTACGSSEKNADKATSAGDTKGALIGVTMPTKSSERWISDGDNLKKQLEALGYQVDLQYAENDIPTQTQQLDNQITKGAKLLIIALLNTCSRLKLIWADSGYDGKPLAGWVQAVARITLEVIKRTELHTFRVVPRRWVVERSFGWLLRYRRLVRDYERRPDHHEAMVYWATVMIMTRRLARRSTDPPLRKRWGQPRSAPAHHPNPTPA